MFATWFSHSAGQAPAALVLSPRRRQKDARFYSSSDDDLDDDEHLRNFSSRSGMERTLLKMRLAEHMNRYESTDGAALTSASAFAWSKDNKVSTAADQGITIVFSGKVTNWGEASPSVEHRHDAFVRGVEDDECEAERLLGAYLRLGLAGEAEGHDEDALAEALRVLAQIEGSFAFALHDRRARRVLAARDGEGKEDLWWGSNGSLLSFSTHPEALDDCMPSASPFPAGCVFLSETHSEYKSDPGAYAWCTPEAANGDLPGTVHAFVGKNRRVREVLRVNSQGQLCGAVLRVASAASMGDLAGLSH